MKRSDGLLIALNGFLLVWAFIGFASTDEETLIVGAMLAMVAAVVNGVAVYRRRDREPTERRKRARKGADEEEMDARTVLDLDARLEALERAQVDAADAARWRALVESGQVSGPAAEGSVSDSPQGRAPTRNGRP